MLPYKRSDKHTQQNKASTPPRSTASNEKQKKTKLYRFKRVVVGSNGLVLLNPPKYLKKVILFCSKHIVFTRIVSALLVAAMLFAIFHSSFGGLIDELHYKLSPKAEALIGDTNELYGRQLKLSGDGAYYLYNEGYKPASGGVEGPNGNPRFSAKFSTNPKEGAEITDPVNNLSFKIKPSFELGSPRKTSNQLFFPISNLQATKVLTFGASGYKEDVVLDDFVKDKIELDYQLELPKSLEARIDIDGSLGIYGPDDTRLTGDISTASESDKALLEKAQAKATKNRLIFKIPSPYIREFGKSTISKNVRYELSDNKLKIIAHGLGGLTYPITIDPSVYIETAAKLMRGNNETNTDFDVSNELIQKSQTTGARIDAWQGNLDMNTGIWGHSTAVAGGYIYKTGGRTGDTAKPRIVDQQRTLANSSTFTMDMPATRPAGDLYVAVMCHDGSDGGLMNPPSGWTEYADLQGHAAYWKIGTDAGGGNEAASYSWTGYGKEEWAGVIMRVTGFDSTSPISGTPGTGSSSTSTRPVFPATTPSSDSTLIIRAVGFDQDNPSTTGWVPSGHTKIDSLSSSNGGNGSCGFAAASLDNPPASGVSTGTATFADTSVNDDYGASSIAINPIVSTPATQTTVEWAKFNSSTLAIESPDPGTGACSGWCADSAYNLPSALRDHSMIAYNGFVYVLGGLDSSDSRVSTVYIAKLGANGEPQLWHPTDPDKNNWVYWYSDTGLNGSTPKSNMSVVAYNNRMYVLGGETNSSPGGITTVEMADILPNGILGTWTTTGMQALPSGAGNHMQGVQVYNDTMYSIGGFEGASTSSANLRDTVYYSKLNSDGTMNAWQQTTSFTTARSDFGGSFSYIWGAYIYMGGGCTAVNASGYCTTIASDMQLASINADGSLDNWSSLGSLDNTRIGYTLIGWQNGLYRLGGCTTQDPTSGECTSTLADVDYGVINPAGEVSTVSISEASGVSPCTGGSPQDCDLPPTGDSAGQGGQMLNMSTILNGYLYVMGGCTNYSCSGVSGNISYVAIGSDGSLQAPGSCGGTSYGAWCVDSTNRINGTTGVAAAGVATFNNRIYIVGGLTGSGISTNIYYNSTNSDGSLAGAWSSVDTTTVGATDVAYTYSFARADPSSAGTYPGNLYIFGGCGTIGTGAGCGSSDYRQEVYKCNIATSGAVSGCTTTGQLQIDSTPGYGASTDGLGIHSGTVYANYIFLIGGYSQFESDKDDVLYAKIDNSNNIVAVSGSDWIESANKLSVGRRRGWAFGYNGHIYAVGGYDASGTGIIPFIEWSKMNVSDGSIDPFVTSSVTINQRWGLSMAVSNSYAYVIGGCDVGASPSGCSSFEPSVQTFQLYNNDSGSIADFTAQSDQTFTADTDRWGASSTVLNGYLYVAGGCISATDCTNATNSVQYAALSPDDGSVGTWNAGGNLPADRAWGKLKAAGGTLYYIGGQDDTATNEQSTVYYTSSISSGNPTWNGTAASNGLPGARTRFGAAVWNDRLYVVGGLDGSAAVSSTVYVSPQLSSGGNITSAWSSSTAFNVARSGGAVTAYANNLYLFGGYDGSNYLSDSQYTQINSDGTVDSWSFTRSLPGPLRNSRAVSANGYIYLIGGRSDDTTCLPKILVAPISANTTIASGNNPTGVGEWYETNVRYSGDRYGVAAAYYKGKIYTMGGGCTAPLSTNRHYQSTVNSQPQVAIYSRMIDTDSDVFPNSWLLNGLDNSIGARWQVRYRSMNDTDGVPTDCGTADMSTWGQETNAGDITLGDINPFTPKDGSGNNIDCARYFYFFVSIDASKTFGYPEDVNRGPTIADLSLFFTSDPNKRLRHGKTFTGGELQPLDTPCRQSVDADCPLP